MKPLGDKEVVIAVDVLPHLDRDDAVTVIRSVRSALHTSTANYTLLLPVPVCGEHVLSDYIGTAVYGSKNRVLYVLACGVCPHIERADRPVNPRRLLGQAAS